MSEGQSPTDDRPLADRRALVDSRTRVHRGYTVRLALDDDETGYDLTVREGETLRASVPGLDPAYLDASVEELLAEFPVDAPPRARAGDDRARRAPLPDSTVRDGLPGDVDRGRNLARRASGRQPVVDAEVDPRPGRSGLHRRGPVPVPVRRRATGAVAGADGPTRRAVGGILPSSTTGQND